MNYLRNNRHKLFPDIEDFTADQPHGNWIYQPMMKTFWFHPLGYLLLYFGVPGMALLNFGLFGTYWYIRYGLTTFTWILLVLSGLFIIKVGLSIKNYHRNKNITMYDIFIRDNIPKVDMPGFPVEYDDEGEQQEQKKEVKDGI